MEHSLISVFLMCSIFLVKHSGPEWLATDHGHEGLAGSRSAIVEGKVA